MQGNKAWRGVKICLLTWFENVEDREESAFWSKKSDISDLRDASLRGKRPPRGKRGPESEESFVAQLPTKY